MPRFRIVVDDRRELLHFVALRIVAADFLDVRHDVIEVVLREIEDQVLGGHELHPVGAESWACVSVQRVWLAHRLSGSKCWGGPSN